MRIIGCVPSLLTWEVTQIIVYIFFLVVNACVLNQSHEHWLFFDVLHVTITMALKLKKEFEIPQLDGRWYGSSFGVVYTCFQH